MKTKFNVGDEVFFYAKPSHLNGFPESFMGDDAEHQVVFKGKVYEVTSTIKINEDATEESNVVYEAAGLGAFIGSVRLTDKDAFSSEEDAKEYALKDLKEMLRSLEQRAAIYKNIIEVRAAS